MNNKPLMMCMVMSFAIFGSETQKSMREYFLKRKEIDEEHERSFRNTVRLFVYQEDKQSIIDYGQHLQKLRAYREIIESKRIKTLEGFRQKHKIDEHAWDLCLQEAELISCNEENRGKSKVIRDENFPLDALCMINKEMKYHGIYPGRVHLSSELEAPFFYCVCFPMKEAIEVKGDSISVNSKECSIGCLALNYDLWMGANRKLKQFIIICMVEELIEPLGIVPRVIGHFLDQLIEDKSFNVHCLITLQKRISVFSMLYASLRDHKTACLMKRYADSVLNNYFTIKDYLLISEIELSWRIIEEFRSCPTKEARIERMKVLWDDYT